MRRASHLTISLAGTWHFRAEGKTEWLPIDIPGCWESLGLPHDWEGPGWFRRTVDLPVEWRKPGRRLWLRFGAVSYSCAVRVNDMLVGEHVGAWDAFTFEITEAVQDAAAADILLRVVKPGGPTFPTPRTISGFLPYVWGFLHGGIWQDAAIEMSGGDRIDPDAVRALPSEPNRRLPSPVGAQTDGYRFKLVDAGGLPVEPGEVTPWNPETPVLYDLRIERMQDGEVSDEAVIALGFRSPAVEGDTPLLNDRPFYPRMALSWGWYARTLHPNPAVDVMRAELEQIRDLGFNGVKCCLWVPPQAYLDLCDEMGLLVWMELPLWLPRMSPEQQEHVSAEYERIVCQYRHHPSIVIWTLGCELSTSCGDEFLRRLYERVKELTDCPLIRDNSGGGECYGGLLREHADYYDYHFYCDLPFLRGAFDYFLPRWRPKQPWFFGEFCDADGFRDLAAIAADYADTEYRAGAAPSNAGGNSADPSVPQRDPALPEEMPAKLPWWMSGDPAVNPQGARWDMNIVGQRANMDRHGLWARAAELKEGQRRQTLLHRKFTIEMVRSYREMSGYVVTGLRDTPISTAGMLDDLEEPRYSAEEMARFNADTVLFLGLHRRRNWVAGGDRPSYIDRWCHWSGDTLYPRIGVSHYGAGCRLTSLTWQIADANSRVVRTGAVPDLAPDLLTTGDVQQLAALDVELPETDRMSRLTLRVSLTADSGLLWSNEWPIWVVPQPDWKEIPAWVAYDPERKLTGLERHGAEWQRLDAEQFGAGSECAVIVASRWTKELADFARGGGKGVVFVEKTGGFPVVEAPFWREAMKLFEPHPLWNNFAHEGFTDLQFYGLGPDCAIDVEKASALLPDAEFHPVLRRVDARTYEVSDYVTEARFPGNGRLLITSLRPHGGLGDQPDGLLRHVAGVHLLVSALKALA